MGPSAYAINAVVFSAANKTATQLMKPFSLTYVRYPEGDLVGKLMAVASLMPISIIVCTFGTFFARRELWDLLTLAGIFFNEVLAQTLKHVVKEPRPASCAAVDFCETYGMPSSHAQLATFAATLATLHLFRRRSGWRKKTRSAAATAAAENGKGKERAVDPLTAALVWLSWPTAVATGTSRVYLGYHSTAQVAAGSVVGVVFGATWHVVCCACAKALKSTLTAGSSSSSSGWIVGWLCESVGIRDSSLVVDPLGVERKALLDAAAADDDDDDNKATTKKRKTK